MVRTPEPGILNEMDPPPFALVSVIACASDTAPEGAVFITVTLIVAWASGVAARTKSVVRSGRKTACRVELFARWAVFLFIMKFRSGALLTESARKVSGN